MTTRRIGLFAAEFVGLLELVTQLWRAQVFAQVNEALLISGQLAIRRKSAS